ncbi:hypothetical protein F0231_09135 [Vibrio sp. RE86]|uniref:hypothetical protein n=1 Tax=Vibrio sp. RE86 TaxID=2607605 RepID=UPI001493C43F|nr:hypothetical protein [Vibrio sp. RE86]NOH79907.1 hypothetical protein [Vibrio sp. RE86]
MAYSKHTKLGILSLVSKSQKIIMGPALMLLIASALTNEQLSYFYAFSSLIAMQQLAELGVGHTIKQFISHDYKLENGSWSEDSIAKIKSYFQFSLVWFLLIGLFILLVVGPLGYVYFDTDSNVNWFYPWVLLIFSAVFSVVRTPIKLLMEGVQKQEFLYLSELVSSISYVVSMCLLLYFDYELYSLSIALLVSELIFLSCVFTTVRNLVSTFRLEKCRFKFKEVWIEIYPLISKVSLVWGAGYFFWNGFNLIIFRVYPLEISGKIMFTLALVKAGYQVSESIMYGQMTYLSNLISRDEIKLSLYKFKRTFKVSLLFLATGYGLFIMMLFLSPDLYLLDKVADISTTVQIIVFYYLVFTMMLKNNYVRCFKIEPFVINSMLMSIVTPVIFYIFSISDFEEYAFAFCTIYILYIYYRNSVIHRKFMCH